MVSFAQLFTLTMSAQAFGVITTSRGSDGLVSHSGLYSTQNSTQPIGARVGSPTVAYTGGSENAPAPAPIDAVRSPATAWPIEPASAAALTKSRLPPA